MMIAARMMNVYQKVRGKNLKTVTSFAELEDMRNFVTAITDKPWVVAAADKKKTRNFNAW